MPCCDRAVPQESAVASRPSATPDGSHLVLGGSYPSEPRWHPQDLTAGHSLRTPVALYKKLDESVIEEELRRMEGAGGD